MTIKTQGGKVITKDGTVSCECCEEEPLDCEFGLLEKNGVCACPETFEECLEANDGDFDTASVDCGQICAGDFAYQEIFCFQANEQCTEGSGVFGGCALVEGCCDPNVFEFCTEVCESEPNPCFFPIIESVGILR